MREGWCVVFSNYQEMNFHSSLFALCAWHFSSTKTTLQTQKNYLNILYISLSCWLSEHAVSFWLQTQFCHNPFRIKQPKNPPGKHNMNSNDFSFSIRGSNKQLIYSHGDTCCRLIKTNVLLADHLLRKNKLTKDKLSCHAINWKKKNMPSWNKKWIQTFINISARAEWGSFKILGEKKKKKMGLK